ncbi:MAG: LysR substrate-binding domain-containing protein [Planctomycetota bacterium]
MRDLSSIELRHLRTFVTVADTENFTRAAERLGITQPSVSSQIKELEHALGAQLFSRNGPRVGLTPAGRAFRDRASLTLAKFNDACQAVQDTEDLVAGHLSLGVIPPLNVPWMPKVLGRLYREHTGIAVTLIEKSADKLEGIVENGRCDLGVGILSHASPNLKYEVLRQDELVLLSAPDGPFARRRSVTAEEVGKEHLVVLPETYVLRQLTSEAFRAARVIPRVALEIDTIDALLGIVRSSGLSTLVPSVVLEGREGLDLRPIKLNGWGTSLDLGIVWPSEGEISQPARTFAAILRETVASSKKPKRASKKG